MRPRFSPGEPPERPADPAVRRANLRRVFGLFRAYRWRLGVVLALIGFSALLSIVSPFLVRDIFDEALPESDNRLLTILVLGLIGIAIVTGILGVFQTWLSNQVGQRVMHDLRTTVYRHLQRLSLAFFTRTRTGEVQSRIANDIGGVEGVVTSTATSIVSNVTTVIAAVVAMFLLDWRLAVFSLALIPLFVLLTRRVGNVRRRITTDRQRTMADISTLVEESLSVSGMLLGKTMGRTGELAERFQGESDRLANLEVKRVMAGRWMMASIQMSFAIMPALVYWFAGQSFIGGVTLGTVVAFTTLQTRLFWPVGSLLNVQLDAQTSLALFDRVFEYLDQPVEIIEGEDAVDLPPCRGDVAFDEVWFRYGEGRWTLEDVSFDVPAGTTTALVGETGSGKTTIGYLVARLYDVDRGSVTIDGIDIRSATMASVARTFSTRPSGRTCASPSPTRRTRKSRTPPVPPGSTT
jgi:ATP-binding cassette subfamily B protein